MKNLLTAIYAKAQATPFWTAIGGRMYQRVPQGAVWPYVRFGPVSNAPIDFFKGRLESAYVQFSVFSKTSSSAEVYDIYAALKDVYDDAELSITGNTMVTMDRQGGGEAEDVEEDVETGEGRCWQLDVDYNIIMQKT